MPVPSASDPFWLGIFPCEYVALLALVRSRVGRALWATRLDGLAGGLAIAAVLASVTVSAAVDGIRRCASGELATNLAYPVGDLVLLGFDRQRRRSRRLADRPDVAHAERRRSSRSRAPI